MLADSTARVMIRIDPAEAGTGAVILFRMRAGAIVKHVGVLTGDLTPPQAPTKQ